MAEYLVPPEQLTSEQIEEITLASDAAGMSEAIPLWLQLPVDQRTPYIDGEFAPMKSRLIPDEAAQKEQFYKGIATKLVAEWKQNPQDNNLRSRVKDFLEYTSHELYFPEIYTQELLNFGYAVDQDGLVTGLDVDYENTFTQFAKLRGFDTGYLHSLGEKIGGLTKDALRRAKNELNLTLNERQFIDDFIVEERQTDRAKANHLRGLQLAERSRRYYLDAGIGLEDFMMLWGVNKNYQTTKAILYYEATEGAPVQGLLDAAATLHDAEYATESEVQYLRGEAIMLPQRIRTWEEITDRNNRITQETEAKMRYTQLTGHPPQVETLHFTGLPGQRTRGNNITYLNRERRMVNIQIMGAHSPESKIKPTLAHEFMHELHGFLVEKYGGGIVEWNAIDSAVKEQFAMTVDSSIKNIIKAETSKKGKKTDEYLPALERWYQYIYGYAQLRFLEETARHDKPMTPAELLRVDEEINTEVRRINTPQREGQVLDLTKIRVAQYDPLHLNDGLNYVTRSINSVDATVTQSQDRPTVQKTTVRVLLESQWGEDWINNTDAYKVVVAAAIASSGLKKEDIQTEDGSTVTVQATERVVQYVSAMIDAGPAYVDIILGRYGISL